MGSHRDLPNPGITSYPVFPSIRVFSSQLALHIRGPKHWSFSLSLSPFSEYQREEVLGQLGGYSWVVDTPFSAFIIAQEVVFHTPGSSSG